MIHWLVEAWHCLQTNLLIHLCTEGLGLGLGLEICGWYYSSKQTIAASLPMYFDGNRSKSCFIIMPEIASIFWTWLWSKGGSTKYYMLAVLILTVEKTDDSTKNCAADPQCKANRCKYIKENHDTSHHCVERATACWVVRSLGVPWEVFVPVLESPLLCLCYHLQTFTTQKWHSYTIKVQTQLGFWGEYIVL